MNEVDGRTNEVSRLVIGAALGVHSTLGPGFLESTYENALAHEFQFRGIPFVRQVAMDIGYQGVPVGQQRLDFLVGQRLIVELKAIEAILPIHLAQVRSYLVAMNLELGLLINFNAVHLKTAVKRVLNFPLRNFVPSFLCGYSMTILPAMASLWTPHW